MTVYASPTVDIGFKKLFGDQKRTDLTRSFLNSVLERKEGHLITEITINDNANLPPTDEQKKALWTSVVPTKQAKNISLKCRLPAKKIFSNVLNTTPHFALSSNSKNEQVMETLVPVIFVAVLDFHLFKKSKDYLTHHLITNSKTGEQTLHHAEFHFIELKKFKCSLEQLTTATEKWVYLIKEADALKQIPRQMKNMPEFVEAFDVLEQRAWSDLERRAYFAQIDAERVRMSIEKTAREDGFEEGLEEGRKATAITIAQAMLNENIDPKIIARTTKLPLEQIKSLKKK